MTIANQSEYDAWNGESGRRWAADPDRHDRVMDRVTEALLDAAALAPDEAVVDIGDWLTIPGAALLRYGSLPDPDPGPGMFAQSDPGIVQDVITASGFHTVDIQAATVALRLGSDAEEATAHLADTGIGRAVLATIPGDDRASA